MIAALCGILFLAACETAAPAESDQEIDLSALAVGAAVTAVAPATSQAAVPETASTATIETTAAETAEPPTSAPSPTATPVIYTVQEGDVLIRIAEQFGTTAAAIQAANGLSDQNQIWVGQELKIPPSTPVGQPAPTEPTTAANITETAIATPQATILPSEVTTPAASVTMVSGQLHNGVSCPDAAPGVPEGATLVGRSAVCNLPIVSYQLGNGGTHLFLIGGIHGGYEWNTILLAYELLDYMIKQPETIPPSLTIHLIPNANPDGLYAVSGKSGEFSPADIDQDSFPGRFNGRNVDLNRNWDCEWSDTAVWRGTTISGGSGPFSEPESVALRDYIVARRPAVVLFWHSQANGVFASGCGQVGPKGKVMAGVYSHASGYPIYDSFDSYDITGDAGDSLALLNIPSFSVELTTHEALDLDINLAGLKALLNHVAAGSERSESAP